MNPWGLSEGMELWMGVEVVPRTVGMLVALFYLFWR